MITKTHADDLKSLHRLCFGRTGSNHEVRRHLRTFCGFDFTKGSDGYTKKLKQMDSWRMDQLKKIAEIVGLERSGKKDELQAAIMDFLSKPSDSGKPVPQAKKRGRSAGKKKSGAGRKRGRGKKAATSGGEEASGTDEGGAASEESEKDDKGEDEDESEPDEPKAKKAKAAPAKKETAAGTSKGRAPRGKAAAKTKDAKGSPPSDDALKATIKDLLKGANLEEITMRDMCRKVYAKFPTFDLSPRKDFIKETVKSVISSSTE
jgi:protein DEK